MQHGLTKKIEKVVIVGGGISGACAARELQKKLQIDPQNIIILEKNDYLGGKLKTFTHPLYPELKAEYGAGVYCEPNYGICDYMLEKGIAGEKLLPLKKSTVEFENEIKKRNILGKLAYMSKFNWQSMKFAANVWSYNQACKRMQDEPPKDQELCFKDFAEKRRLMVVATFLRFLIPGFGYGSEADANNYAFRILNYMGISTMPAIFFGGIIGRDALVSVHGGYQQLVEKMLEGFNVKTSAQIQHIDRENDKATIYYTHKGKPEAVNADLLVLAASPYFWKDLGMTLTDEEKACVEQLTYYRYPVAICRIKGLGPQQEYVLSSLDKEGFGHPAFLFTRDNRNNPADGRLFTVYINLPQGNNDFNLEDEKTRSTLIDDIKKLEGVTDVEIEDTHIWPDYNPAVPWKTGINLQKKELNHTLNTLHVGTYLPGGFETVAGAEEYARKAVNRWCGIRETLLQENIRHFRRGFKFFRIPRCQPVDDTILAKQ